MRFEGLHHVTAITGDAARNVDFYARVLGLRLVKKTVNQDDPTVYHLFYADEEGEPRLDITFFEYPGATLDGQARGWCIASSGGSASERRSTSGRSVGGEGRARDAARSASRDPEGLEHELAVIETTDGRSSRDHPEFPPARTPGLRRRTGLLRATPTEPRAPRGDARLRRRRGRLGGPRCAAWRSTATTRRRPSPGSGGGRDPPRRRGSRRDEEEASASGSRTAAPVRRPDRALLLSLRLLPRAERRPVRDRHYRAGVHRDEPRETLGQGLSLPPAFEHLRARLEPLLTPLPDPRATVVP